MTQRSSSSSISVAGSPRGSPSAKPRGAQAQYGKRKLKAEAKLDTRLLRRVQRGEKPQNVTKLVKKGAKVDCIDKATAERPLHVAAVLGHVTMINALLAHGANLFPVGLCSNDPAKVNAQSMSGDTALHLAAQFNCHTAMAALLVGAGKNVNVNARNAAGRTAFHIATECNSYECWYMLLDAGADIDAKDNEDRTPLHLACTGGFRRAVSVLVQKGAKINHTNRVGNTPLHTAVLADDRACVEALLALGADVARTNLAGYNPFRMAVLFGRMQVIEVLHNATPSPRRKAPSGDEIVQNKRPLPALTNSRGRAHTLNVSQDLQAPVPPPREKPKIVYKRSISASSIREDKGRDRPLPAPPFDVATRMSQRGRDQIL